MSSGTVLRAVPAELAARLRRLERAENFPVALRVLPRAYRDDLRAVYDVARFIDDVGDEPGVRAGDRLLALDVVRAELEALFAAGIAGATGAAGASEPTFDVLRRLAPVAARRALPAQPFLDLVEANRRDQTCTRYPSYDALVDYCRLSANPVGRIVLAVFGCSDVDTNRLSDDVCTALQLLEHCQDVAEDLQLRDRLYLPVEDLDRFAVSEPDLQAAAASAAVRQLVGFETDRAARLLAAGPALVTRLHGWARVAVTGYVAGGLATVDALRRADHDVLQATPRPRRRDVARHAMRLSGRRR